MSFPRNRSGVFHSTDQAIIYGLRPEPIAEFGQGEWMGNKIQEKPASLGSKSYTECSCGMMKELRQWIINEIVRMKNPLCGALSGKRKGCEFEPWSHVYIWGLIQSSLFLILSKPVSSSALWRCNVQFTFWLWEWSKTMHLKYLDCGRYLIIYGYYVIKILLVIIHV